MPKTHISFRLGDPALDNLDHLTKLTGSTQASIVEQSLAIYRVFLSEGLEGVSKTLAPEPVSSSETVSSEPSEPVYTHRFKGETYEFNFPLRDLRRRGSDACPCGSGKQFKDCHSQDFENAVRIKQAKR